MIRSRHCSTTASTKSRDSLKRSVNSPSEGHRSDTDSGRSSDVENIRKPVSAYPQLPPPKPLRTLKEGQLLHENPCLKITRLEKNNPFQNKICSLPQPSKHPFIGYESETRSSEKSTVTRKHPVVRRMNKRNDSRRNTIEVNTNDLLLAEKALKGNDGPNLSKSTNHIDKVGQRLDESLKGVVDAFSFDNNKNGVSLPGNFTSLLTFPIGNKTFLSIVTDLTIQNIYTRQTNLKVRRHRSVRDDVKLVMPTKDDGPYVIKTPEFISNATLPPKYIDIADSKVRLNFFMSFPF